MNAMHSADWTNLESVNLSGLKAEGIQGAYNFLKGAKITSLDLSGLNFANCSGMNNFASDCSLLKTVNLTNTTFTGVLYGIFSNCPALSQVITTNMDTAGVTWYGTMFQNCPSLHELDLSSWNTAKATGFNKFADGSGLNKIIIGNNVISGSGFFPTPATTASGKASNGLWGRDSELVDAGVEKVYTASELDSYGSTAGALTGTWYAQAEPTYYTVRFDANKGSGTMEDEQIAVGQTTALSKNSLYRDGYALQGWSTSADADTAEYADTASVKDLAAEGQTATLYAVWDVHPVTDDVRETFTSAISGDTAGEWTIDERRNGKIDLTYDTTNGSWADTDGNSHPNGTFIVRIPTAITYENMNAGSVSTDNIYDVTVAGALTSGKQIEVSAESGKSLVGENLLGNITELTSMSDDQTQNTVGVYGDTNKRLFTAGQASVLTDDGMVVKGTTVTDDIAMSGIVYSAGSYRGTVQYSAALR